MDKQIYGYIRVSSNKQTVENQRFEITEFCKSKDLEVSGWIEETISGTQAYNKRALGRLLRKVRKDDIIICSELSRLGRNLFMIMEILSICMKRKCCIWTIKDNYRLGDSIESKVLAFAFSLSAELERTLLSQRTKEALARKKAEGVKLGRPVGSTSPQVMKRLEKQHKNILAYLSNNLTKDEIARRCHCSRSTLYVYLRKNCLL